MARKKPTKPQKPAKAPAAPPPSEAKPLYRSDKVACLLKGILSRHTLTMRYDIYQWLRKSYYHDANHQFLAVDATLAEIRAALLGDLKRLQVECGLLMLDVDEAVFQAEQQLASNAAPAPAAGPINPTPEVSR